MSNTKDTPKSSPPAELPPEVQTLIEKFRRYGMQIVIVLCVVMAAVVIYNLYQANLESQRHKAQEEFAAAIDAEDFARIKSRAGADDLQPLALLALAKRDYDAERFREALDRYDEFLVSFPAHDLTPAAQLGRLHSMEALGMTEDALAGFSEFVATRANHFLAPQARLGYARCLEALERNEEALNAYEALAAAYPETLWEFTATSRIAELKRAPGIANNGTP